MMRSPQGRGIIAIATLALVALAGCASKDATVTTDVITPGVWDIRADTDHILAWAHNSGDADVPIAWSLTSAGGAALPAGWNASFSPADATLSPVGSKVAASRGYSYPDWARTLITLTLPEQQGAGTFDLVLHAGEATKALKATVHADRTNVSGPGSRVEVHYEGRFHDTGEVFDDGDFPTTLGSAQTVPGFSFGLMGLAPGETATISIPPPFGYGYDDATRAQFLGKTLDFTVTITSLEG
jgi:peptidylprolyl isomerase